MSRMLIKGGCVVTMDPQLGELPHGDVLIENGRIAAVAPRLDAPDGAETIDASGMIVMPGLINGHLHTWQSALRGIAGDWTVAQYMQAMHRGLATLYRPEDIYIANLMGALNQINNGATTLVDWCHNNPTPAHTDAAIEGLAESGIRAVFLHGSPKPNPKPGQKHFSEIPMPRHEVERLRKGRFASDGGLMTFGLAILGPYYSVWDVTRADVALANELDLLCSMHVGGGTPMTAGGFERLADEGLIKPNFNVVHGNDIAPATIQPDRRGWRHLHVDRRDRAADGLRPSGHRNAAARSGRRCRSAPTSRPPRAATCSRRCASRCSTSAIARSPRRWRRPAAGPNGCR